MNNLVPALSGWAMHYLTHSAVLLIALSATAWLGDRLLRRVGPQARHRMWVAALLLGVALPLLPAGWFSGVGQPGAGAAADTVTVTYRMIAAATERWTMSPAAGMAICAGYLLTILFCFARLLWRWRRTSAMARRSIAPGVNTRAAQLLDNAAQLAGIQVPAMRCSAEIHGPVVLGWRWPLLIVPENFFDVPDEDIAAALAHECVHLARRDFAKNLLYEFAAIAIAYHPACWWIRRKIAATRELICDEAAAAMGESRAEYAASLLRLARAMAVPASISSHAIGVFDGDILEERIMRLTMDVPKMSKLQKIAMITVTACAMLGGAVAATAMPSDTASQASEKIYKIGGDVKPPVLIHSVDAEFSKKAKDAKYQGVSVVSCIVDADGMPRHVRTKRKLGMGLDEKAIEAVRQYRFQPSTLHGKPVAVAIMIEVNFRIY